MNKITFVYGLCHADANQYIRRMVQKTGRAANSFRNITNPDTLRGLKSTENTTIEFVWLRRCACNPRFREMQQAMQDRRTAEAGIVEYEA